MFIFVLLRAGYFSVSEIIAKDSKTFKISRKEVELQEITL
jgi:inorganic pyrophosphatase/exopolyphosphatase